MKTEVPDVIAIMKVVKSSTISVKLCPRCLQNYFTPYGKACIKRVSPPFAALSRRDNKTNICSNCGT